MIYSIYSPDTIRLGVWGLGVHVWGLGLSKKGPRILQTLKPTPYIISYNSHSLDSLQGVLKGLYRAYQGGYWESRNHFTTLISLGLGPHPLIVTPRDNGNCVRVLIYS